MGVSLQLYRARIGSFRQRAQPAGGVHGFGMPHLYLKLHILLLMLAGDVELNPGPDSATWHPFYQLPTFYHHSHHQKTTLAKAEQSIDLTDFTLPIPNQFQDCCEKMLDCHTVSDHLNSSRLAMEGQSCYWQPEQAGLNSHAPEQSHAVYHYQDPGAHTQNYEGGVDTEDLSWVPPELRVTETPRTTSNNYKLPELSAEAVEEELTKHASQAQQRHPWEDHDQGSLVYPVPPYDETTCHSPCSPHSPYRESPPSPTYPTTMDSLGTYQGTLPDASYLHAFDESPIHDMEPQYRPQVKAERYKNLRFRRTKDAKLWEFLWSLLEEERAVGAIKWIQKESGIFKIVNSSKVATLWGKHKSKKNMKYEFMARAIRFYYKSGIMQRIPNQRLTYQFGPVAFGLKQGGRV